jgi:subtilisin family serine protease
MYKNMFKNQKLIAGIFIAALPLFSFNLPGADELKGKIDESSRKIVVFEEGVSASERDEILGSIGAKRIKRLNLALEADVLENLSASEVSKLALSPKVKRVDNDAVVYAQSHTATAQAQTLPWGIDRIDAELVWPSGNAADPIKVGIIDTGISLSHPDLQANIKGGYNAIRPWRNADDDNGHGSHVAGIVAAINNAVGVIGGAHQADLYAIKVLNAAGSGYLSDVIEGIDKAISWDLDIINLSLGCACDVQSMHDAVIRAKNAGIVIVAAAGNDSSQPVIYPAAYPEVIAVSATDSNNNLASWSSRGPEVDLSAPGVSIYSTYKGKSYATLSGTSMASPHVAASAALVLNTPVGANDANGNGKWDPNEVQTKLQNTATDLGSVGFDNLYGHGLVNAYQATQ